jgi:hypothetical protein
MSDLPPKASDPSTQGSDPSTQGSDPSTQGSDPSNPETSPEEEIPKYTFQDIRTFLRKSYEQMKEHCEYILLNYVNKFGKKGSIFSKKASNQELATATEKMYVMPPKLSRLSSIRKDIENLLEEVYEDEMKIDPNGNLNEEHAKTFYEKEKEFKEKEEEFKEAMKPTTKGGKKRRTRRKRKSGIT